MVRARRHGVVATLERERPNDHAVERLAALYRRIAGERRSGRLAPGAMVDQRRRLPRFGIDPICAIDPRG